MKILTFVALCCLLLSTSSYAAKVIQIGDSQSQGIFGLTWSRKINKESNHTLDIYARGGSTALSWVDYSKSKGNFRHYSVTQKSSEILLGKMEELGTLLTRSKADLFIIQLGGNMVGYPDRSVQLQVKSIVGVAKAHGMDNCIWIGPPNGHKRPQPRFSEFYKVLKSSVEEQGCSFIDSRPHTTYPAGLGDGIHYDSLERKIREPLVQKWVDGIFQEMINLI